MRVMGVWMEMEMGMRSEMAGKLSDDVSCDVSCDVELWLVSSCEVARPTGAC